MNYLIMRTGTVLMYICTKYRNRDPLVGRNGFPVVGFQFSVVVPGCVDNLFKPLP